MTTTGQTIFEAAYEVSPIILQDGLAQFSGGYLPITAITEIIDLPGLSSKQFFAHYKPLAGSTLAEWQIAEYPFVNLTMAANAQIQMPLKISMLMVAPAQTGGGYLFKQAIFTALQVALQNHISLGGSFTVITPAFTYTNCLLTALRDVTSPSDKQVQTMYQWDFVQPLITESGATQIVGQLLNRVGSGLSTNLGGWSSTPATLGLSPGEEVISYP
jgi:hypothetical protein